MDGHALAEARSLALHRLIAERVRSDPALIVAARDRLARWSAGGALSPAYVARWTQVLSDPAALHVVLTADTEDARALRQTTPFSFVVPPRERWRIWRETKAGT